MHKFYNIANEDAISTIIGNKSSIKFSSAFNLNDPNELKFHVSINPLARKAKSQYFKANPDHTISDFESWKANAGGSSAYTAWSQRDEIAQSVTLASFSLINDNNLMWSHYANVHTGICVLYRPELVESIKSMVGFFASGPVKYSTNPPTISNTQSHKTIIRKSMFNKQTEWKYEKEFRIVRLSTENVEYVPIPQSLISSVAIGSRTEQKFRQLIIKTCNEASIDIFHASTMSHGYRVAMLPHDDRKIYMTSFWG